MRGILVLLDGGFEYSRKERLAASLAITVLGAIPFFVLSRLLSTVLDWRSMWPGCRIGSFLSTWRAYAPRRSMSAPGAAIFIVSSTYLAILASTVLVEMLTYPGMTWERVVRRAGGVFFWEIL